MGECYQINCIDAEGNPKTLRIVSYKHYKSLECKYIRILKKLKEIQMPAKKKDWIQGAIKKPGALHKELGVPQGQKIPAKKMAKAAKSSNPKLRRQVALAKTLSKLHK